MKPSFLKTLTCATSLLFSLTTSAALSGDEQQMADYIDGRKEAAMSLLEKSVNINSGTMNFSGVRKVADQLIHQ